MSSNEPLDPAPTKAPPVPRPQHPRFFVKQDASGRWGWDYWRPGESRPVGIPIFLHTLREAKELAALKNSLTAKAAVKPDESEQEELGLS